MRVSIPALAFLLLSSSVSVSAQVSGTVVDDLTDEAITDAVVSVQASNIETSTDDTGAFNLADAGGLNLVIVAGAKGYFYSSETVTAPESGLELRLEPVPQVDNPWYTFQPPERCKVCHEEQYEEWFGSPMSKAGLNTWVYDIYNGEGTGTTELPGFIYLRDSVHAEANPESECASCHQPEPWAREPFSALGDFDNPTTGMAHGVACDMCHRIADIDISKPNFPGIYPGVVTLTRPVGPDATWKVMYGVLGDADYTQSGWMRASYQPQMKSEVCAACHQDKNDPDLSGDFESEDAVISEPTYLEWLDSDYADPSSEVYAECVDCHMPATGAAAACDRVSFTRPDGDVRSHNILGTTPEYLENALTMTMDAGIVGDSLEVDVAIVNDRTGHHVPTGVTIRNMILLVEAWQVSDGAALEHTGEQTIHDLGGVGEAGATEGYYAGLPGKLFGKINIAEDGSSPTFFTDAVDIVEDNRIHALATDETSYSFRVPADAGEIKVRARVIYRRSWRALVDGKQWKYDGHGNTLEDIEPPHFGHLMDMEEMTLGEPLPEPMPDAGVPDGGEPDGGSPEDDGGGGCSVSGSQDSGTGIFWLLVFGAIALGYRRSRC
jgi:MYXO-CTERM domain-containing protein